MVSRSPVLSAEDVVDHVRSLCEADRGGNDVGVELEWLTRPARDPHAYLDLATIERVVATAHPLPAGGTITFEPGGQVELSTRPSPDLDGALSAATVDAGALRHAAGTHGIELTASGVDAHRRSRRLLDSPRYRSMQTYFDADGEAGRRMMCSTAAMQLNVGCGPESGWVRRFRLAQAAGPVLVAAFANSPVVAGRRTGWRSNRMATWWSMDTTRCRPVVTGDDLPESWARFALSARVMAIRIGDAHVVPPQRITFEQWMRDSVDGIYPDTDDLAHHLTTLFPPVRLKGWLELRMLDSLPSPYWEVAATVGYTLLARCDPDEVEAAVAGTETLWEDAARHGLDHPALAAAAARVFAAVRDCAPASSADAVASYCDRFVDRRRCPADDALDAYREPAWT